MFWIQSLAATFPHHFSNSFPFLHHYFSWSFTLVLTIKMLFYFFVPTSYLWHWLCNLIFIFIFSIYFPPITAITKVPREHFKRCDTCWIFAWFLWFLFMVKHQTLIYEFDTSHVIIPPIILLIYWWYFAAFWLVAYDISIVVNMHKPALSTLPRVLLARLNFILPCMFLSYVTLIHILASQF